MSNELWRKGALELAGLIARREVSSREVVEAHLARIDEREPEIHPRLLTAPRTVLWPHLGSASHDTRVRMATTATGAVAEILAGGTPANLVT